MKIKNCLSVLLSAVLTMSAVTPCFAAEEVTADSLVEQYRAMNAESASIACEENVAFAMNISALGESLSMKMDMNFDVETAEEVSHLTGEMSMEMEGTSEEDNDSDYLQTEIYSVKEAEDAYTVYTLDTDTDTWSKSEVETPDFNMDLAYLVRGDSFVLSDETADVDGTECYEVTSSVPFSEMLTFLGNSLEDLEELLPVSEEEADAFRLDVVYYFDTDSKNLVAMKMDGTAMMEEMIMKTIEESFAGSGMDEDMDLDALKALFEIEIPAFCVEINHIEFGTIDAIEIPEEALAAETVSSYDFNGPDEEGGDASAHADENITFEGMTAVDNDECAIILEGIVPDDSWGYTINADLENKSADKKLMFSVETAYVNGVENDPFFASEVAPGKKAKESITFDYMDEYGITEFTDIEIIFRVYDSEDWSADDVAYETVHVYPHGEENAEQFVYEPADTDQVLYDDENCSVIAIGTEQDDWDYAINLYLVNKTDKNITISADDVSVNGYMCEPYFARSVNAGKSVFTDMDWSNDDLEENGITEVEEVELTLSVYDADDWSADHLVDQVITFSV